MADATVSRLGEVNAAGGDKYELFLKVFSGETLTAFVRSNIMFNGSADSGAMHTVRSISQGKSAQFPVFGQAVASYHTPGAEITGQQIKHAEKTISIDQILLAPVFIARIDEAMNHYDVRAPYSAELGRALAKQADKNLIQLTILAARASATITGGNGGSTLTNAGYETTPDTLAQGIYDAGQAMDEKDVPEEDRFCILRPAQYNLLVQASKSLNRDFNASYDNGTFAQGKIFKINGIQIKKSNNLPSSVINAATGENNTYSGTFTNTMGVVFHKSAVGTVKLLDLAMESEYDIRRQGTLFVAKYAMGHGVLRPEAAVELKKA